MKKLFTRITAAVLAGIFTAGLIPEVALAKFQMPVTSLSLTDNTTDNSRYTIRLQWEEPQGESDKTDGADIPANEYEKTEGYRIFYANSTKGEKYNADTNPNVPTDGKLITGTSHTFTNLVMESNSLYTFKVLPVHWHYFTVTDPKTGIATTTRKEAPMDTSVPTREGIYLTDIEVSAYGKENELSVEWINPTLTINNRAVNVFDGYNIYYAQDANGLLTNPVSVSVNSTALTKLDNGMLRYTFDANVRPGEHYMVKVEPYVLINSRATEVRTASPPLSSITVKTGSGNVNYALAFTKRDYIEGNAPIEMGLEWVEENTENLRLKWRIPDKKVKSITVYSSTSADFTTNSSLGTLVGSAANTVNFWLDEKPEYKTWYRLFVEFEDGSASIWSKVVTYDPTYKDFEPYMPTILEAPKAENGWSLFWEAFVRPAYTAEERLQASGSTFVDRDMTYEIWVTDEIENFTIAAFQGTPVMVDVRGIDPTDFSDSVKAFSKTITQYDSIDGRKAIEENKIYYVRIRAIRGGDEEQKSPWAYGSYYVPPTGSIPTSPLMMAKPPLRFTSSTATTIAIQWETRWYEVFNDHSGSGNTEQPEGWYTKVGWNDETGSFVFGNAADGLQKIAMLSDNAYTSLTSTDDVKTRMREMFGLAADTSLDGLFATLPCRFIDLSGTKYEIHTAKHDYVLTEGGAEAYLDKLTSSSALWNSAITPTGTEPSLGLLIDSSQDLSGRSIKLEKNTAYVIFFRTYTGTGATRVEAYPVYLTATTLDDRPPLVIEPLVPTLEIVDSSITSTSMKVRWAYSPEYNYEMSYGELITNYPSGGTALNSTTIASGMSSPELDPKTGELYVTYTINNLFPNTGYYVWIRSVSASNAGNKSSWSSPDYAVTSDIAAPPAPSGLGLASADDVSAYNKEKKTDFTPTSGSYLILSWLRNQNDTAKTSGLDAPATVERLDVSTLLTAYVVKCNELIANRVYYVRAQTILTVKRAGNAGITTQYSYRVQLADNEEFIDAIDIYVPALEAAPANPADMLRKESEWTVTLHFKTQPWTGEYDGTIDSSTYPLPTQDFEITYDSANSRLTYRLRSNSVGADGNKDNGVDQRFISRLLSDRAFTYEMDLTSYSNQPVKIRTVELPYSVVKAFDERKISLRLKAGSIAVTIAPGSLKTAEINALKDFGANGYVRLTLTQQPTTGIPIISSGDTYASVPQQLGIQVNTPSRAVAVKTLAQDIKVDLKLSSRYVMMDNTVNAYLADSNTQGWEVTRSTYDSTAGTMSFNTKKAAAYSAIAKAAPSPSTGQLSDAGYLVASKLNITDMKGFNPSQTITANQLNNFIAAIANNRKSVAVNSSMSDADYQSLGKARLLVTGSEVSREAGISALVRLYELKTGQAVKNYGTAATSPFKDISGAKIESQAALLKAAKLGFFDGGTTADPKAELTIGDALEMLGIIIADAGM